MGRSKDHEALPNDSDETVLSTEASITTGRKVNNSNNKIRTLQSLFTYSNVIGVPCDCHKKIDMFQQFKPYHSQLEIEPYLYQQSRMKSEVDGCH